jgi:Cytochrome c oxidase subunit IV
MKIEARFLIFLGIFFGIVGAFYFVLTYKYATIAGSFVHIGVEDAGFVMLIGTCTLGLLPGLYYLFWYRRSKGYNHFFGRRDVHAAGPRPSDREDATMAEGAGEIDSFPSSSIWPFILGMGAFLVVNALVFGWWLIFPGIVLILTALVGVTAESRRGGHV